MIKRLVLNADKPYDPGKIDTGIVGLADKLSKLPGVEDSHIILYEIDKNMLNLMITLEGQDIDFRGVKDTFREYNVKFRSVKEVYSGSQRYQKFYSRINFRPTLTPYSFVKLAGTSRIKFAL